MGGKTAVLAIDQGTTSSRALVFDGEGRILSLTQKELPQHFPKSGWVEHDAEDIWRDTVETAKGALEDAGLEAGEIAALGITNQRETTLRRVSDFLGINFTNEEISEAIAFCSFEKLQEREREGFYGDSARRSADKDDPNSFKVRRGKVGGYRDDFTNEQLEEIDSLMRRKLNPEIGHLVAKRDGKQFTIAGDNNLREAL